MRVVAGVLIGAAGIVVLVMGHTTVAALRPVGGAALVVAASVVIFGPWWLSLVRDLIAERQARALAEERAQMAAHVHDSVLQTLALIQRSADDPQNVVRLARAQERELRAWLFEGRPPGAIGEDATMLAEGVGLLQRQVEADHGIAVQVVMVGDCELDEALRALLDAAREATVNAAKWSGADQVSVYAEVEPDTVMLYVRDRGRGFDPDAVPDDRQGIAQSIRARMVRFGGTAVLRSAPGDGAEVQLSMPRRERVEVSAPGGRTPEPGGPASSSSRTTRVFRAGVRAELGDAVEVVGEADEAGAAVELILERLPEVVLLDVHLPGGGGHAVLRGVHPHHPEVQFLALSVSDAPEDVIEVIRAGARGYITKTISGPSSSKPSTGWPPGTPSSRRGSPVSCSTRSPRAVPRRGTRSRARPAVPPRA